MTSLQNEHRSCREHAGARRQRTRSSFLHFLCELCVLCGEKSVARSLGYIILRIAYSISCYVVNRRKFPSFDSSTRNLFRLPEAGPLNTDPFGSYREPWQ